MLRVEHAARCGVAGSSQRPAILHLRRNDLHDVTENAQTVRFPLKTEREQLNGFENKMARKSVVGPDLT